MNIIKVIVQIALLYCFYLLGSYIQTTFNLFIPGSVIGLILLFILLVTNVLKGSWIEKGARFMTNHLVLFFIPPTVGIMHYFHVFSGKGFLLIIITIISTIIVIGLSGLVSERLYKRKITNE